MCIPIFCIDERHVADIPDLCAAIRGTALSVYNPKTAGLRGIVLTLRVGFVDRMLYAFDRRPTPYVDLASAIRPSAFRRSRFVRLFADPRISKGRRAAKSARHPRRTSLKSERATPRLGKTASNPRSLARATDRRCGHLTIAGASPGPAARHGQTSSSGPRNDGLKSALSNDPRPRPLSV
jgi:hypothetical protein